MDYSTSVVNFYSSGLVTHNRRIGSRITYAKKAMEKISILRRIFLSGTTDNKSRKPLQFYLIRWPGSMRLRHLNWSCDFSKHWYKMAWRSIERQCQFETDLSFVLPNPRIKSTKTHLRTSTPTMYVCVILHYIHICRHISQFYVTVYVIWSSCCVHLTFVYTQQNQSLVRISMIEYRFLF
jgi:hypothetical protein